MEDKWTRGLIAGTISGIIANSIDILMGNMGLTTFRFVDWMSVILYDHIPPFTFAETVFSFMSQIFFCGGVGVVFIYLVPLISSRNLYLKSWYFSMFIWYAVNDITTLFNHWKLKYPTHSRQAYLLWL